MVGRRVTLPAESTLSVLNSHRPFYILLHAFNNQLHHGKCATQLRQFEPNFDFGFIFFLIDNARLCSVNLHLAELTRACEPKCIHSKKFSRVER